MNFDDNHQKQSLEVFYKISVLKNFTKFTRRHLYWSLFLNKDAGLGTATLLKKKIQHRCFLVNFAAVEKNLETTGAHLQLTDHFVLFKSSPSKFFSKAAVLNVLKNSLKNEGLR